MALGSSHSRRGTRYIDQIITQIHSVSHSFNKHETEGIDGNSPVVSGKSWGIEGKAHRGNLCCGLSTAVEPITPNLLVFYEVYGDVSLCSLHLQTLG